MDAVDGSVIYFIDLALVCVVVGASFLWEFDTYSVIMRSIAFLVGIMSTIAVCKISYGFTYIHMVCVIEEIGAIG